MCLAIPSKIVKIEDNVATIDVDGVRREASLLLVENPKIGDYVVVHAGFAMRLIRKKCDATSLANLLMLPVHLFMHFSPLNCDFGSFIGSYLPLSS